MTTANILKQSYAAWGNVQFQLNKDWPEFPGLLCKNTTWVEKSNKFERFKNYEDRFLKDFENKDRL